MKKTVKHVYVFFLHAFALVGFTLMAGFFAVRFHITDVKGAVDNNSEKFSGMVLGIESQRQAEEKKENVSTLDYQLESITKEREIKMKNACEIDAIGQYYPVNAKAILDAYEKTQSDIIAKKMIFAVSLRLKDLGQNSGIEICEQGKINKEYDYSELKNKYAGSQGDNAFKWMNNEQWQTIEAAIIKDKDDIEKASAIAGIEPRLVVSSAIVEQLRLFHSQRELYEKFFEPLKILGNSNKISWGVMGIKEATAIATEEHLKDKNSPYYLGENMENVLDFSTNDIAKERYTRLTTQGQYYYSYLYGALYLKQMLTQWEKAGYDIKYRPEIVGTLFNIGFPQSKPNANPSVGGSQIDVEGTKYSFGSLAYEFYYSNELTNEFPFVIN